MQTRQQRPVWNGTKILTNRRHTPPSRLQQVQHLVDQQLVLLLRRRRERRGCCHPEGEGVVHREGEGEVHYPEAGERSPKRKNVSSYTSSRYRPRSGGGNLYAI